MNVSPELATSAIQFIGSMSGRMAEMASAGSLKTPLAPQRVRALTADCKPLDPDQVRRAMVRQVRPGSCGRGGLPGYVLKLMHDDYRRLGSLAKAAKLHGRTRQALYDIFKAHDLPMNKKCFLKKKVYNGRSYTPGKHGYYRATSGDRVQLHYAIWQDAHGAVPDGHQVTFKNADRTDFRLENLACMPIREVTLFHHARHKA